MKFLFFLILIFSHTLLYSQQNPFNRIAKDTIQSRSVDKKQKESKSISDILWTHIPFSRKLINIQRDLSQKFSLYFKSIKKKPDFFSVFGLLLLAFAYGIIHSIGPGHAKLLFLSHTVANPTSISKIFGAGFLFSIIHTGTSVFLFFVMRIILDMNQSTIDLHTQKIINTSGILLIIAGLLSMFSPKLEKLSGSITQNRLIKNASNINILAFAAGLVPCPGAFLILVFSDLIGIVHIGILAVISVSIGMALVVSTAGSAGGTAANLINSKKNKIATYAGAVMRYAACGIIVLTGLFLTFG